MVAPGLAAQEALRPHQIKQIERALADVGELPTLAPTAWSPCGVSHSAVRSGWAAWRGEVRLIKAKGKLRFIQRVISEEALTLAETQEAHDARVDHHG